MNKDIVAYYSLRKFNLVYKLDYLIIEKNSKKVLIKAKKRIKDIDLYIAHKQSVYYILRNILALKDLGYLPKDTSIEIGVDCSQIVDKLKSDLLNKKFSEDSLNFLINKLERVYFLYSINTLKFIYRTKKPNLNLFIKSEKKAKEYSKFIRRKSLLTDLKKDLINKQDIIFFDFEMNCLSDFSSVEIISIGAVKTNILGEIKDEFYRTIKPNGVSELSEKCIEITGLLQKEIDKSNDFNCVFNEFLKWANNSSKVFCFWGGNDLKVLNNDYKRNLSKSKIVLEILTNNYDFQEIFCKDILRQEELLSIKNALKYFKLDFIGNEHNALNDAINLSIIYKKIHRSLF
ncbi:3'-5' exonuclease [Clostridium chrysemydis]|uniref:3'-5' exonuclease n=1 Tax=Clostridium chrysemydis TaxID=2665504 RepID=UPI001883D9A7|nr:3'-5' exonuclease [Clostridium chrysemydis]